MSPATGGVTPGVTGVTGGTGRDPDGHRRGDWYQANEQVLAAAVEMIRSALTSHLDASPRNSLGEVSARSGRGAAAERHRARAGARTRAAVDAFEQARAQVPGQAAIDQLVGAFSLSPFERDVLLLCAAVELDGEVARLCGRALGVEGAAAPCFSLALAALPAPRWAALLPGAPLRWWQLVTLGAGATVTSAPLRIAEPVLHHLTGSACLDEQLGALLEPVGDPGTLPPSHQALAARAAELWRSAGGTWPVLQLCGKDPEDTRAVAAAACGQLGMTLRAVGAGDLPADPAERHRLQRLWERDAVLTDSALYVDAFGADTADAGRGAGAWVAFVRRLQGAVLVGAAEPAPLRGRGTARLDVPPPGLGEQVELWAAALGGTAAGLDGKHGLNGQVERVVAQFQLGARQIRDAGRLARDRLGAMEPDTDRPDAAPEDADRTGGDERPGAEAAAETGAGAGDVLWDICRAQTRTRLEHLAQRIRPAATMADLVLDDAGKETLAQTATHVRHRLRVYERWGFAARSERGLGISALFVGPSGTGKTMAAEVVAGELRLDLYRIDLSAVVSKYIGETEKNLARVFDAAEAGGSVLLFDEADAVFGKRSEVRDSHDRYANIEVSYLLQRIEAYRGLAILTTNLKHAIDPAFMRRIRFVVHFPFPDAASREQIWRRVFPAATPVEALDYGRLSKLNVPGGSIRNIALGAAFLAADEDAPVGMGHLLRAAHHEYAKLERPLTPQEVGGWA